jgi:putative peptidoglycan lipid II flippase
MTGSPDSPAVLRPRGIRKLLGYFRPSHQHTAFSATVLLMVAIMLSRVIGYVREAYIAYAFGAGPATDAYVAGFTIPDWLNYLVAGGTASITFISIYTRFLAEKKEDEAQKTFSVIITVMTVVLSIGILIAEIYTPEIEAWWFKGFSAAQLQLCVHLTRILLPAQLFFYVGGVFSALLLSHRLFLLPAFGPLLYNVSIIVGGVVGAHRYGIQSLAWGALIGTCLGPFLLNLVGAVHIGTGYHISFDIRNPAFREWVRMSIPLMLGVSLVSVDDWILRYFASGSIGDITRLNYAKRLFAVPIAVLGQATSQASLPFFARLWGEKRLKEFAGTINGSVYRLVAASLLATSWMMASSLPLIDLVYRRGHFHFSDTQETSIYFFWFSTSLCFWAAQSIYSRGFYATGNTLTPMFSSSIIVLLSVPVYSALYHSISTVGLAIASDIGIAVNTIALAVLLHWRNLVPANELEWGEIGKAGLTAVIAGLIGYEVGHVFLTNANRTADLKALGLTTLTWLAAVAAGLWITKSKLPQDLRRRRTVTYPRVAEAGGELSGGIEP